MTGYTPKSTSEKRTSYVDQRIRNMNILASIEGVRGYTPPESFSECERRIGDAKIRRLQKEVEEITRGK